MKILKIENARYKSFLEELGYGVPINIRINTGDAESRHLIGKKENVYKALVRVDPNIRSSDIDKMCPHLSNIKFGDKSILKDDNVEDLDIEDDGKIDVNIIRCDMKVTHRNFVRQITTLQCEHCKKSKTEY